MLRSQLKQVVGVKAFPNLGSALPTSGNFPVEMVILSTDSALQMLPYAEKLVKAAQASGKFMFVDTPPHLLKTFLQTVGEASALDGMLYSY